jgi:hypothetical protein
MSSGRQSERPGGPRGEHAAPAAQPAPQLARVERLALQLAAIRHYSDKPDPGRRRQRLEAGVGSEADAAPEQPHLADGQPVAAQPAAVQSEADIADGLVAELRAALGSLRAALAMGTAGSVRPYDEGGGRRLGEAEAEPLWRVAAALWNAAVEGGALEALRRGGASAARSLQGAEEGAAAGGREAGVRAREARWRRRVTAHLTALRSLAADAAALLPPPPPSLPPTPMAGCAPAARRAWEAALCALERARWRLAFATAAARGWLRLGQAEAAELSLSRGARRRRT